MCILFRRSQRLKILLRILKLGLYEQPSNRLRLSLQQDEQILGPIPEVHSLNASNAHEYVNCRYVESCKENLGYFKFAKASLCLQPDARPVFRPKRLARYAFASILEAERDCIQKVGVISEVDYDSGCIIGSSQEVL
ncbi:hypothetical protein TTRE_0000874801 [Trichuris trichiura]|uniref:Uncharacterized protein n=1 Tax=Trichuris trichiura TaxID=36087 RepID=A0A077ZIY5_TRITR|nr:hypothetical protein TTRE_0000874801 [Trichuris trichiura]